MSRSASQKMLGAKCKSANSFRWWLADENLEYSASPASTVAKKKSFDLIRPSTPPRKISIAESGKLPVRQPLHQPTLML